MFTRRVGQLLVVFALSATLLSPSSPSLADGPDFYDTVGLKAAGKPGSIVRAEVMPAYILPGLPFNATAWRVLYRSTGATGKPQIVSGTVLVPKKAWSGAGSRPLVGYALGTPGMADHCAPSRQFANGTEYEATIVASALSRGWALALTDYPGLGTPGDHQYVVGRSLGRAVLDSMRAARALSGAGISSKAPTAIYGYSEGGEAAGWALQLQGSYAPDLKVRGGALGAAPADFVREAAFIDGKPFAFLLGYVSLGFAAAYPELAPALRDALTPRGKQYLAMLNQSCLPDAIVKAQLWSHSSRTYLKVPPLAVKGFKARLIENNLGNIDPKVPLILQANRFDEVMAYDTSGPGLRDKWCRNGASVKFVSSPLTEHLTGVIQFWSPASTFLSDRLSGLPATRPADCPKPS